MRVFVAIDLPGQLKEALDAGVAAPLRPALEGARWTRPQARHITLKFLGEVEEGRVSEVDAAVAHACTSHAPFEVAFDRIGGFPSLRRPRVLWVGIGPGSDLMQALAAEVDSCLEGIGFPPERRPFQGHVTLARFNSPGPVGELPAVNVPGERFGVDEVVIFRSELRRDGARYTALNRFPLS